jgi:hypothetical protein
MKKDIHGYRMHMRSKTIINKDGSTIVTMLFQIQMLTNDPLTRDI